MELYMLHRCAEEFGIISAPLNREIHSPTHFEEIQQQFVETISLSDDQIQSHVSARHDETQRLLELASHEQAHPAFRQRSL